MIRALLPLLAFVLAAPAHGPPPLAADFFALAPAVVRPGDPVELEWFVVGADGVSVETDAGWVDVPPVGKCWVRPKATRGYALVAWDAGGAVWCELGILVEGD